MMATVATMATMARMTPNGDEDNKNIAAITARVTTTVVRATVTGTGFHPVWDTVLPDLPDFFCKCHTVRVGYIKNRRLRKKLFSSVH